MQHLAFAATSLGLTAVLELLMCCTHTLQDQGILCQQFGLRKNSVSLCPKTTKGYLAFQENTVVSASM